MSYEIVSYGEWKCVRDVWLVLSLSKAIYVKHFTLEQISAMIDAALANSRIGGKRI
jgi:hypothetical protein